MTTSSARGPRRTDALSRDRIITATVEILDADGEDGLTVRALTAHLSTGRGAIYHHVSHKGEMLSEAVDHVIERALDEVANEADPQQGIRAIALGIFDAIAAHPWVGSQLSREPRQPAVLRIWKTIGSQLDALGLAGSARSNAGYALINYVLGAAAQYVAGPGRLRSDTERAAVLEELSALWIEANPDDPLIHQIGSELRDHDDRKQFLAGVAIFIRGISATA